MLSRRIAILALAVVLIPTSVDARGWSRCRPRRSCCVVTTPCRTAPFAHDQLTNAYVSPSGLQHWIYSSSDVDVLEELERQAEAALAPDARDARNAQRWDGSDGETFAGVSRRVSKVSVSSASVEPYENFTPFRRTLAPDDVMRSRSPPIPRRHDSERVREENRNVDVDCYLYAAAKMDDNDFHLIVGGRNSQQLLNVEISGLPPTGPHRQSLDRARDQFLELADEVFGRVPGGTYMYAEPPVAVSIRGSLFYDMDHPAGQVGPQRFRHRIDTSWEIHPITRIGLNE